MDLQAVKLGVLQKILSVNKVSLLEKIDKLLDSEMTVGYTTEGEPLTKKRYNERLEIAENQISAREYQSQEDLEREVKSW